MAKYRHDLPQLTGQLFLTDGGLETTLIFHDGLELPDFAAFVLLDSELGRETLRRYYRRYAEIARGQGVGSVLESATWRASADWGLRQGYTAADLDRSNKQAVELLTELRRGYETPETKIVVSGCVGPRGDGYDPGALMTVQQARAYHSAQIKSFSESEADMVTAITMTNSNEAIGLTRAAQDVGMPVAISFTVETDGRLPTGLALGDAIESVDAATGNGPAYYMVNCAHPTHFDTVLRADAPWAHRLRGIRANASTMSHAELDVAEELDDGNPQELGDQYRALRRKLGHLSVLGGCCGTDHRHVEAISLACAA